MGLDIPVYSHMTLLDILPDEQAWQQKYGDADEDDDASAPTHQRTRKTPAIA